MVSVCGRIETSNLCSIGQIVYVVTSYIERSRHFAKGMILVSQILNNSDDSIAKESEELNEKNETIHG